MVFYAAFNSISVISRRQLTLFISFRGFTSTRLGSEVLFILAENIYSAIYDLTLYHTILIFNNLVEKRNAGNKHFCVYLHFFFSIRGTGASGGRFGKGSFGQDVSARTFWPWTFWPDTGTKKDTISTRKGALYELSLANFFTPFTINTTLTYFLV